MRIAIDVSQIIYRTGVSHYCINLVKNLLQIDDKNQYQLFAGVFRRKQEILNIFPQTRTFPIPPKLADILWNKLHVLLIEKLIGQVDLVHTSDWAEPPSKIPKVTTIHDITPLKFPKLLPKIIVETHKKRLEWVAKESKRVIVPSQNTKNDLMALGFDPGIISVIYEAPNLGKASEGQIGTVKRRYRIFGNYIIAIGTAPRKNIERIIKAYHLTKFGKDLKLVIVGENNGVYKDERGVIFLGNINDSDLSAILSGALVLVFPSLYEGLGVPILDAFNCEVPVVTSNVSSMPEVADESAVLVDPYDVGSISDGIEKAISSPKSLIGKGLKRVKDFSWQKTAEETLKVYKVMEK